jgi:hypothetical protein
VLLLLPSHFSSYAQRALRGEEGNFQETRHSGYGDEFFLALPAAGAVQCVAAVVLGLCFNGVVAGRSGGVKDRLIFWVGSCGGPASG